MKKENKADRCPVCGGENKMGGKRLNLRVPAATVHSGNIPQLVVADGAEAESSDDQTANAFAALLMKNSNHAI